MVDLEHPRREKTNVTLAPLTSKHYSKCKFPSVRCSFKNVHRMAIILAPSLTSANPPC
jgi:hypothetical protein